MCRIVAVGLMGVVGLAGCGSSKSGDPNPKVFIGKLKTTGRVAMVAVAPDLVSGEITCPTPVMNKANKTATYVCTTKTTGGQAVKLTGSSTYAELKLKTKGAFHGKIVISVDGVTKTTTDCLGKACPAGH